MAIGYACLTVGVEGVKFKTCRKDNANEAKLKEIISFNLASLDKMLDYNILNGIGLMRITSDIIPFGSHPVNQLKWWDIYRKELFLLGEKAKKTTSVFQCIPGNIQYSIHQRRRL